MGIRVALFASGSNVEPRIGPPARKPSQPAVTKALETDRRAAESVLKLGGFVRIRRNGLEAALDPGMSLPTEAFQLTDIRLGDQLELTDAVLEPFEGLPNLIGFSLNKGPKLTDAGVAHLRNLPRLESLWLDRTAVKLFGWNRLALRTPGSCI